MSCVHLSYMPKLNTPRFCQWNFRVIFSRLVHRDKNQNVNVQIGKCTNTAKNHHTFIRVSLVTQQPNCNVFCWCGNLIAHFWGHINSFRVHWENRSLSFSLDAMAVSSGIVSLYPLHVFWAHTHFLCLLRERECAHLNVNNYSTANVTSSPAGDSLLVKGLPTHGHCHCFINRLVA